MRILLHSQICRYSPTLTVRFTTQLRIYSTQKSYEPLRILFCGSDEFSSASLRALHNERQKDPALIASIDVVCRPGKPVGRGLRTIRKVPILGVAKELSLPLYEIDTFTKWEPPKPQGFSINLIVAVSFGLLVPPRILEGAQYGGLNVHPSMLPDFHGPAPLHHTLLSGCERTGVTVQTLHPKHFDKGTILAQTAYPGFLHNCSTVPELLDVTASECAELLMQCIKSGLFLAPNSNTENGCTGQRPVTARPAPKIKTEDRHVVWDTWTSQEIVSRHRIIGPLWNNIRTVSDGKIQHSRIIWSAGFVSTLLRSESIPIGQPIVIGLGLPSQATYVRTCDNTLLQIKYIKIEGGVEDEPVRAAIRAGIADLNKTFDGDKVILFRKPF